jgi:glycine cleavage system H protein
MEMKKINKYEVRTDIYYEPETHFWVNINGNNATIGMSPLVQETSGSFVAVQMEETGAEIKKDDGFGTVEAEKHVGPLKSPLSGKILSRNTEVLENPRLINIDPYNKGWLIEMELTNLQNEIGSLISGEEDITEWFESELKKFDEKGWIAQ